MWAMSKNPINPWEIVWRDMQKQLKLSGLWKEADIEMFFIGDQMKYQQLKKQNPDVSITQRIRHRNFYEWPTLHNLWTWANKHPEDKILYLHSKGVTRRESSVADWRKLMFYFSIDRWKDCIKELEKYDAVGVNLQKKGDNPWFAGNIWWANANYISKLPEPKLSKDRLSAEFWIGKGKGNFVSLHNSRINHYKKKYPENLYRKK